VTLPAVRAVNVLWRFSRPHTIIGTALSVIGLYAIAAAENQATDALDLAATLIAALAVNIAIVGVNQLTDVEIDRVNKPYLPIAAGDLTPRNATIIVAACTVIPLAMALTQGAAETIAVAAGLTVGALYSLPPARLKRFPLAASLCITGVRSVVVNLGVYWHFAGSISPPQEFCSIWQTLPTQATNRRSPVSTCGFGRSSSWSICSFRWPA
jgi:homogentisate phytyltransferase/homogentisate geranylgeranyltransferase